MSSTAQPLQSPVLISYSAPSTFLASPNWSKVHAALLAQLPLRNIHWKSPSRASVSTIQELDVTLVSLESVRDELTSQVPVTVLERPLLHIYVVYCEDNDLETYRTVLKKQIKDWHTSVTTRRTSEWLILQIIRPESRAQTRNVFQRGSVLDKLKTDFNTDKRDRCLQVNWITGNENPLVWAEFFNKVKDSLMFAFDSAISQRQEEVKRSESQQQMPGWNFCTFFILKESVATSFEGTNLFDGALVPYDELEDSFHLVWREKNMSWFGNLINLGPADDSSPLLSITKKPYRDLILANTISVFDFRIYLLSRQCELLAKLGRIAEVTRRVGSFLTTFGWHLREIEASLPRFFIESWTYSSALTVVDQCNTWSAVYCSDESEQASCNAGKGELLEMARSQLDRIGVLVGHLPSTPNFFVSTSSKPSPRTGSGGNITNEDLLRVIADQSAFYETYIAITNRAIDMYTKAGRRKFALKLHGSLAALDLYRGNLSAALSTYTSLPAHYAPHVWTSLESYMLSRALDTHAKLNKEQDVEWIHILLAFLKTCVEHQGSEMLMPESDKLEYVSNLVKAMKLSASRLDSDLAHPDHSSVSVSVSDRARLAKTRDGSYLDVTLRNLLPCSFPADEIIVILSGRDAEKIRFTSTVEGLPPGKTSLALFCPTPSAGTFLLDSTEIRVARLFLKQTRRKTGKAPTSSKPGILVRIPPDLFALNVRISQSGRIQLGKPPSLMAILSTGRNHVSRISFRLSAPSITFRCQEAALGKNATDVTLEATEDHIELKDVAKDTTVTFSIPHSDASAFHAMKVNLAVEYTTIDEPSLSRTATFAGVLVTTLPISVNVEDFFRGTRLISKFTVSTTSHQHVRIADASLDAPDGGIDGVKITSCSARRGVFTVTPAQPANFLFALDSEHGPVRESLTLCIKYRMLREEVESVIQDQVQLVLDEIPDSQQHRLPLINHLVEELERDAAWVDLYGITGELVAPESSTGDEQLRELLTRVKKRLSEHTHPHPSEREWREIKIPVDVPYMNIVAAACVRLISTPFTNASSSEKFSLYAGQPISANLTIHTSFHWGSTAQDTGRRYNLRFNIEEMVREWLVSGPKRGDFIAMDGGIHVIPITLIALHHGEFSLPKVTVTALPMAGDVTMGSMAVPSIETYQVHGAEKVLVLPRGGRSTFVVGMGPG